MDLLITGIILLLTGNAVLAVTSSKTTKVKAKADTNIKSSSTLFVAKATQAKRHWATYSKQGKIVIFDSNINPLIK